MSVMDETVTAQASHDPLTTLPNRTIFMQRLKQALSRAGRTQRPLAVLFVDLDNFKQINDTLGHQAGDHLLILVSAVLQASLRASDTAARLGGDEFVVLLEDLNSPAEAARVAERILRQLDAPFSFGEHEAQVSASIGVAVSASPLDPPEELLHHADVAMYRAKQQGKDRFEVFDQQLSREVQERRRAERDLRQALAEPGTPQLRLEYQPEVRLDDDDIVGVEALVRWDRPGFGLLRGDAFLPLAEESGLIGQIGSWVLREACRHSARWRQDDPTLVMSVNLSGREFYRPELAHELAAVLRETELDPAGLALEIPEAVAMRDPERASAILQRLHALGVKLALDRFGESCASLRHLRRWPLFFVKIDRRLISELLSNRESAALVDTLIAVAHVLDLRVLGEGVEIAAQAAWLRERDCDLAQGDYFARASDRRMIGLLFGQDISALA